MRWQSIKPWAIIFVFLVSALNVFSETYKIIDTNSYGIVPLMPFSRSSTIEIPVECRDMKGYKTVAVKYSCTHLKRGRVDFVTDPKNPRKADRKYTDLESSRLFEGDTKISFKDIQNGRATEILKIPVSAQHPYGYFSLNIELTDDKGGTLFNGKFCYAVAPEIVDGNKTDIFGMDNYGGNWISGPNGSPQAAVSDWGKKVLSRDGLSWAHIRAIWGEGAIAPDKCLENLDAWVDSALAQKAKIIMVLADGIPRSARKADLKQVQLDMEDFRKWAGMLMERYKGKVSVWDVWNEPDSKSYAQADGNDMEALKIAHEFKMKYCPDSKVIISPHASAGLNYIEKLLEGGAGRYLDGIGLHPYRGLPPEIPERDGYTGNRTGKWTYVSMLEDLKGILKKHNVPQDIYVTEKNYNLNYLTNYDENNQADFMMRMQILSKTVGNVKCFIQHAPFHGRFLMTCYPNLFNMLGGAEYKGKAEAGDSEIFAYVFNKDSKSKVIPVWTTGKSKVINISNLETMPEITDIYGNLLDFTYNNTSKMVESLKISQSPVYIVCGTVSDIQIKAPKYFDVKFPESMKKGQKIDLEIGCEGLKEFNHDIHAQSNTIKVIPEKLHIDKPGIYKMAVQAPEKMETGSYPLILELKDQNGKTVGLKGFEISVEPSVSETNLRNNIVFSESFDDFNVGKCRNENSAQTEFSIVTENKNNFLSVIQTGIDHPGMLKFESSPLAYGIQMFKFNIPAAGQSFIFALDDSIKFSIDSAGLLSCLSKNGYVKIKNVEYGKWHEMKCLFDAPEQSYTLIVDNSPAGKFEFNSSSKAFRELSVVTGVEYSDKPKGILIDDIRFLKINPVPLSKDAVLEWTLCGPFDNRTDPVTMKRPFDLDYLKDDGGETGIVPYPGLEVPYGEKILSFTPFVKSKVSNNVNHMNFFSVKEIGLPQGQADIICYAAAYVFCPKDGEYTFSMGSDDYYHLWVNHVLIGKINGWPTGRNCKIGSESYKVNLKRGLNLILLKVHQGDGSYQFAIQIE